MNAKIKTAINRLSMSSSRQRIRGFHMILRGHALMYDRAVWAFLPALSPGVCCSLTDERAVPKSSAGLAAQWTLGGDTGEMPLT
jgi:hypothetical protein